MGIAITVAVFVGISIAVQVLLVGGASRSVHPLSVSLALQGAGLLAGAAWATWRHSWPSVTSVVGLWWWLPIGALGWGIVAALGYSAARLGTSTTLAIVVGAQLVAGLILDLALGHTEFRVQQPIGVLLLTVGALLVTVRT